MTELTDYQQTVLILGEVIKIENKAKALNKVVKYQGNKRIFELDHKDLEVAIKHLEDYHMILREQVIELGHEE